MNRGGFSWKRLLGITRAKSNISRSIGIPLTKSGRQRKIGKMVTGGGCLINLFFIVGFVFSIIVFFVFMDLRTWSGHFRKNYQNNLCIPKTFALDLSWFFNLSNRSANMRIGTQDSNYSILTLFEILSLKKTHLHSS